MQVVLAERGPVGKLQFSHDIGSTPFRIPQSMEQEDYLVVLMVYYLVVREGASSIIIQPNVYVSIEYFFPIFFRILPGQ
jgi:hypothetical protein